MPRVFQKRIENFTCEHCGFFVEGSGYTNHCPRCLWSKHVDKNPGDRLDPCRGLMEPISAFFENGELILLHQCERCGVKRKNKTNPQDDRTRCIELTAHPHSL